MTDPATKDSAITAPTVPLPPDLAWGSGADADRLIAAGTMGPHLTGPAGTAPNAVFQYSVDGSTSWHATWTTGDLYVRVSVDGGATWSGAMRFVGAQGPAGPNVPTCSIVLWPCSVAPTGFLICNGPAVLLSAYPTLIDLYIGDANNANTAYTYGYRCTNSDGTGRSTSGAYIVLPDLREAVPVGIGTRGAGVSAHDAFALAEFKDDQKETHTHGISAGQGYHGHGGSMPTKYNGYNNGMWHYYNAAAAMVDGAADNACGITINAATLPAMTADGAPTGRTGTVTRGKSLGFNFIIKY